MNVQVKSSNGITLIPIETRLLADRKVFIEGEINQQSACDFIKKILLLCKEDTAAPIDVLIDSLGGEISAGLLMYDCIQSSKAPIRMFCIGMAYSMGALLFACGNHGRYMLPHSELMLHEPLLGSGVRGNASSIRSISDSLMDTKKKMNQILAKHTGKTMEEIEKATRFDHYFSPEESIEFGLADEIVGLNKIMGDKIMKTDRMVLGENAVYSTNCNETGLNNNVLVCASSGAGKTVSIMEPRLLETFNSSLIVTVTKRRLVDKYKDVFKRRSYNVLDLNFVNPEDSTVSFDPLAYITSYSDITFLAESIVMSNPRKGAKTNSADPYWDEASTSLLSSLIAYVLMTEDKPTFTSVLKLMDSLNVKESGSGITTSIDAKFERIAKKDPNCFAVTCWNSFRLLPIKTASSVYCTLNTTIDTIFSPELRKMIENKKNVDFEQLASQKTILFVSTSAVNPSLNCFVNMFYAQMFKQMFEFAESLPNGKLPIPTTVLCDDFATGSKILNFPEYISIFREKQISVVLLCQSESQLERMYGYEDMVTIINNCDTYVYMGGMDLKTAHNISLRLNVPLDEVLYMPIGHEIIFRRGSNPLVTTRIDITKNKEYQKITRQYEKKVRKVESKKKEMIRTASLKEKQKNFIREIRSPSKEKLYKQQNDKLRQNHRHTHTDLDDIQDMIDIQTELEIKFNELFGISEE